MTMAPVALFIFNRPEPTRRVFERIRAARPERLLVVADGPRADRPAEADACRAARDIAASVDWPCDVRTNYSDANLGCKRRVASGLDWVFQLCESAIILEDDCVPEPTLFRFFDEMLARYRDDARVMMVSGTNPLGEWKRDRHDYHFSYCGSIWNWASWRRAWRSYDVDMKLWADEDVRQRVRDVFAEPELYEGRVAAYDAVARGKVDTWDMQWSFARIIQSGLSVVPAVNLVRNVGFGPGATHTHKANAPAADLPTTPMTFPLREPRCVAVDREYDRQFTRKLSGK
jgi:hypothetical protein